MEESNISVPNEDIMRLSLFPEVLGGVAHELAQPLNAITLACEVMRLKIERTNLPPLEKEFFDVRLQGVRSQVTKTGGLIDQFRSFFTSQSDETGPVDIEKAFDRVFGLVGQQFAARGIKLSLDRPQEKILSAWSNQIVEIAIAQCLVLCRNRLVFLKQSAEALGQSLNCDLSVQIKSTDLGSEIDFSWDEELNEALTEALETQNSQIGIVATMETIKKLGGDLLVANGLIKLILK